MSREGISRSRKPPKKRVGILAIQGETVQIRTTSSLRIENPLSISAAPFLLCQDRTPYLAVKPHSHSHLFQETDS